MKKRPILAAILMGIGCLAGASAQTQPEWTRVEEETIRHFQALLRLDTSSPPGNESRAADYLEQVLESEGIPVRTFVLEPGRANLVARLKGNGRKRPLLVMAHTDVVTVDATKWAFPPFGGARDGGYVYGRGALDDKDNLVASLMVMLMLKRQNVPLDRDVIFLAEAGEEGGSNVGINFMVDRHFAEIDAEYCLAEGGDTRRIDGKLRFVGVQALERHARTVELTARGTSGHASVPLESNPIAHLSAAVAAVAGWQAPIQPNEITTSYFRRLADISPSDQAARYRAVLAPDSKEAATAFTYFLKNEPNHASLLHTSISPTIVGGGYRVNVIPSEAKATLDVRMVPDETRPFSGCHPQSRQRSCRRGDLRTAGRSTWYDGRREARFGGFQSDRIGCRQPLRDDDHSDHVDWGDRHGATAREGNSMLRHRAGHRH